MVWKFKDFLTISYHFVESLTYGSSNIRRNIEMDSRHTFTAFSLIDIMALIILKDKGDVFFWTVFDQFIYIILQENDLSFFVLSNPFQILAKKNYFTSLGQIQSLRICFLVYIEQIVIAIFIHKLLCQSKTYEVDEICIDSLRISIFILKL